MTDKTRYSKEHEWVLLGNDGIALIGISNYAKNSLGDLVYVELPDVGSRFKQDEHFAIVESVKAASEVYAPVSGEVVAINEEAENNPEILGEDITQGWIIKMKLDDPKQVENLMDLEEYNKFIAE
jgi:glycine cleavage system H protein